MLQIWKHISIFLFSVILLSGCIYYGVSKRKPVIQQRPNIIIIMADDLGWNDVSFHGSDQVPTPNIDALAYNGVILQRHYVLPICTPSRTAFLTGRYPIRTAPMNCIIASPMTRPLQELLIASFGCISICQVITLTDTRMQGSPLKAGEARGIPLNNTLLPEYLRKLGYATHIVGKWHVGYYSDYHTPAYRGFDSFLGYYSGYVTYFNHTIEQESQVGYDLHYDIPGNLSARYNYEYMTDLITKRAEDIISNHDSKKPLYLQLSHLAAHSSDAKEEMEVRDPKELNATFGYIENYSRRKFAGVVSALDESVGKVVRALKQADMLKNTIIVFMSDNGAQTEGLLQNYGSNYPLRGLKFTLFEGGIRGVACIYSSLIKKSSRISNQLIHITDWLPTLYSIAGGNLEDLEENLDGIDQWATISSEKETGRKSVLLNIDEVENLSGALMGRYKLINGAKLLYGDYYGDRGTNKSYPEYSVKNVLNSLAGSAIASATNVVLNDKDVSHLRKDATVVCNNFTAYARCVDTCLFDIYDDPCETTDLSNKHPQIVAKLNRSIAEYYGVLMHQTNTIVDPASYPEHFNGTWMPWIKLPPNNILSSWLQ